MGVLGLWKLVDATGKPVPLETLEGKVLAIDISIWIHQVIQGYQDRRGNAIPNAHLIGLFNRICKLMYFKIKPVFVFDGGVPLLKKNTIATRRKLKSIAASKAQKLKNDLINNLIKHTAVKGALDKGNDEGESSTVQQFKDSKAVANTSAIGDMYKLPDVPAIGKFIDADDYIDSDDDNELKLSPRKQTKWIGNIHSVDVNNEEFKNLPADVRYDILTDLKETRKQNSWGRLHELPTGSNTYSGFQVTRLLKRRYVQESLEAAEKEMGGKTLTLDELDQLLTDQGISTTLQDDTAFRIASDSKTRVIYFKDTQSTQNSKNSDSDSNSKQSKTKEQESNSNDAFSDSISVISDNSVSVVNDMNAYDLDEEWNSDEGFETTLNDSPLLTKNNIPKTVMNPALAYMLENSGLTRDQILKIVEQRKKDKANSEGGSSHTSSRKAKGTPRCLSTQKKNKRKLSFEVVSTDIKPPKIKKEASDDLEVLNVKESTSESDDFVEVSEKPEKKKELIEDYDQTITKESSDDESDDFVEVQDVPVPELSDSKKQKGNGLQIMIKADEDLDDDIFADVFSDFKTIPSSDVSLEKKFDLHEKLEAAVLKNQSTVRNSTLSISEKSQSKFSNIQLAKTSQKFVSNVEVNKTPLNMKNVVESNVDNEAMVKTDENLKDDIFADVFSDLKTIKSSDIISEKKLNAETEEPEVQNKSITREDSKVQNIESEDSVIDDISVDSEALSKADNTEELITDNLQKDNKVVGEIEKEPTLVLPVDEKELESMKQQLETEQQQIAGNLGKLERQATDITDQMRLEAQELLRLFGIPYLVAPMEAEAQCAYLEQINLTDGTITDDSDIWLFGGGCVYKNFFDNNKKVLQFLSNDIEHHFNLTRKEMIQLAILVGSDYTNGLAGVGPVTALEILAAFPSQGEDILRGLRAFAGWFRAGKLAAPGKISLRNKLKNVQIEKGFPSQAVVQAYLTPTIDESKETFTWGKPNLVLLADYVKRKFGWTKFKFDEIMAPVMKRFNESQSQKGIDSYFKVHHVPKSIETALSKRVQSAIQKLSGKSQADDRLDDDTPAASSSKEKVKKPRKTAIKKGKKSKNETSELPAIAEIVEDENKSEDIIETIESKSEDNTEATEEVKHMPKNTSITEKKPRIPEVDEVIPQRERDKANALNKKLRAIEIYRKSRKGLDRVQKKKKVIKKIKNDAELSESSSD